MGKFDKYIVRRPLYEDMPNEAVGEGHSAGVTPAATFMSSPQVAGSPLHISWGVIYGIPDRNPYVVAHDHPYDEVLFFTGFNPENTEELGATVELELEDEAQLIDSTCAIYIPAGMKHCPMSVRSIDRPYGLAAICLAGRYQTMDYETPLEVAAG